MPDGSREAGRRREGAPTGETPGLRSVTLEQVALPDVRHLSVGLCVAVQRHSPPRSGDSGTPAGSAREGLLSLIELHINTVSCEVNRAMRVIAVLSALVLIPMLVGHMPGMTTPGIPFTPTSGG